MITARLLAYRILLHLDQKPSQPDRLIRTLMDRHSGLEARDRALLTELVYGTLRWQVRLDWHIAHLSRVPAKKIRPGIRIILRMGLYQLLFLERVPAHAAIDEAVKIAKSLHPAHLAGFVNGVLREAARRGSQWDWPSAEADPALYLSISTSHPAWFVSRLLRDLDFDESRRICEANNCVAPLTIRVNGLKIDPGRAMDWLLTQGIHVEPSPHLEDALRIRGMRFDLSRLPAYLDGWVQVQDEASQLIGRLVSPGAGERVLDLCAGFGGKTTHMAALMGGSGDIVAVDSSAWKLEELKKNGARQGITGISTVSGDLMNLSPAEIGQFDRVLLDAPCTGFGTLRRNPDIKWRRHPKDPYRFSQLQKQYIEKAAGLVREGGVLVYATCSPFREENEEVAEHFTADHPGWTREAAGDFLPESCKAMTQGGYFRSRPDLHDMDGFFGARWRRGYTG
jgi:16S rRNA (cytosine967-C5)-methyltransferase